MFHLTDLKACLMVHLMGKIFITVHRKLKVLKFTDLVDYKIALVMYKVKHGSLPSSIQAFFSN